ncbi:MAG: hypothetical protein HY704_09095, partial [Gemmatimonadetes bacterium]|nr:hypothetical protein [Gemmatimonadota bacterium]
MRKLRWLLVAALAVLPLAGCDEGEEVVEAVTGTIQGTVTIEGTGAS